MPERIIKLEFIMKNLQVYLYIRKTTIESTKVQLYFYPEKLREQEKSR